ncbi:hypothetical protein Tco_1520586, partial [Tanacetum coccineum]
MAISVISISSDSSEDSVGTPAGRVILFGTIPTTIPDTTPVVTPLTTQTDTPSDPSEDPSSDHIPPLPATSPFLSSDDDPTDSDTPDTPSSPTHDTPFTEITASTQRSLPFSYRRVMLITSGQLFLMVGTVHATILMGDSSSEASSDFHSDASSDSSSRHSLPDHSSPDLPGTSAGLSRKRRRSPMTSVPALSPDSGYLTDVEVDHRETSLGMMLLSGDRGIDARVVVEAIDRDETETGVRGPVEEGAVEVTYETLEDLVQRFHDHTQAILVHRIQAIEGVQRDQGHRIVGVKSAVIALTERLAELEKDNRRLRGTMSVKSQ